MPSRSPRGEGWHIRLDDDANAQSAESYACKDRLAVVYGVPKSIDDDGTIVLEYRFLRIVDRDHFTTNDLDYGRFGQPFRPVRLPNTP